MENFDEEKENSIRLNGNRGAAQEERKARDAEERKKQKRNLKGRKERSG